MFHQLLEHRWYLSEQQGRDIPLAEALTSYITNVLRHRRDEATVIEPPTGTITLPVDLVEDDASSDDGVDCRNSLAFAAACKANKVPVTLHLFEKGGHGYGLHGKGELEKWPSLLDGWLKAKGYAKP